MIIDEIRMDHIRRCQCGRKPEVMTHYDIKGWVPGDGPFVIKCYCGRDPDEKDAEGLQPLPRFARSWSKTRVVKIWRSMNC